MGIERGAIDSIGGVIDSVGDAVDRNTESGEERQLELSSRQAVDMASDSWLSKNIRPMTLIYLLTAQTAILTAMFFDVVVPESIIAQVGVLLFGAFGFYFNSRKGEKMMAQKVKGALKIEEMRTRAEIKQERRLSRKRN